MTPSTSAALGADLAAALDPVRLAIRASIMPDPWQCDFLRSAARQMILCCSRQSGKSTVTAIRAAHKAVYEHGSLTLILAPSQRQAIELLRKTKDILGALGQDVEQADEESATRLEFSSGSRIIALPGKEQTIRGFSGVDLLIEDEASRASDDLYRALRPMLAVSGGQLILLSTPWGRRGHFYEAWTHGGDDWERYRVPADQCPRISPGFLESERRSLPDHVFRQEYLTEFTDTEDQVFRSEDIERALQTDALPLFERIGVL